MTAIPKTKHQQTLMIQGTTSDAGKSVLVAGLCRVLARKNISVAPFKPQNMALNSAVTKCGGEIGRAQAVQAQACFIDAHTDMNPVLLKPNSDIGAQVIIHGKVHTDMDAQDYHHYKTTAMTAVLESHSRLEQQYRVIMVEGAGSPAEINLRDRDIANMGFAEAVDCPVIIVSDIDRGGVFAHLVGTLALLSESEQKRVKGFVINRFRGDIALLQSGLDWLEERTGKPVLGVLPYLHNLHIEAEDAITTQQLNADSNQVLHIAVPVLTRTSNHTDFDALRLHPQVNLQFIRGGDRIPSCDLIIIPGSKSVRNELPWLSKNQWDKDIKRHLRFGGKLMGICGGYQLLGNTISDPHGIEGAAGESAALKLLDFTTEIKTEKQLLQVQAQLTLDNSLATGYEIHAGESTGPALEKPFAFINDRPDGVRSEDGQIIGTYLHGIFDHEQARETLLKWAGLEEVEHFDYRQRQEDDINRFADCIEEHLDMKRITQLLAIDL